MPTELPDLRQVRAFVAVAETESFTRAAERLYLTQSAVSHSIRGLEENLGSKLVDRMGKRICLTQDGVVFLRGCRRVLQELTSTVRELDALKRWGQGRIRIGATHSLCHYMLPMVLREFRDCFPRCEIHIESGDTSKLIEMLDSSRLDVALGIHLRTPGWCRFQPLFEDALVFVVSPQHPWVVLDEVTPEAMAEESYLVYAKASETYRLIRNHTEKAGVRLRATLSLGDMEAIKAMAKIGIGVGIVAPWVASKELEAGELVALPIRAGTLTRSWGVFTHESKEVSLVEETFVGICEMAAQRFEKTATPA